MRRVLVLFCAMALVLGACGARPKGSDGETPANSPAWAYYEILLDLRSDAQEEDLQYIALDLSECTLREENRDAFIALMEGYCEEHGLQLLLGTRVDLGKQGYITAGEDPDDWSRFPGGKLYKFLDTRLTKKKLETVIRGHRTDSLYPTFRVWYTAVLRGGQWRIEEVRHPQKALDAKPVIYLYPERPMQVDVTLTPRNGYFTETVPAYGTGWRVLAQPDGTLTNFADGKEYPYLFWEGISHDPWPEFAQGFLVKREELEGFLRETLAYMGLIPAEYEEFIAFWAPMLARDEYHLIYFAGEEHAARYPLGITPAPDSLLRVFMVAKPAGGDEKIAPQALEPFRREGFAVIEWGGTVLE